MGLDSLTIISSIVALLLGLTLHEFAHAWMGDYLGDTTAREHGRLTINPIAHIDPFNTLILPALLIFAGSPVVFAAAKPVPFNPWAVRGGRWGAAMVAFAGPATNLIIAIFFALWLRLIPYSPTTAEFLSRVVIVNVGLFVFNMIPFPPLDGSRLLYAVAPAGLREAMDAIERGGLMVLLVIMFVGYRFIASPVARVTLDIVQLLMPPSLLP